MRHVVRCEIQDTVPELYTQEQADAVVAGYPAHEREARARGIPQLGSGRVFPIELASVTVDPFPIPRFWRQIVGVDFGWDHPFAAARLAHDPDADVLYVCNEYLQREATPVIHAAAIRGWGAWLPVAWPHDGLQHDKQSGKQLAQAYRDQQLNMLHEHATFENEGGYGFEAGVSEMLVRMQVGKLKFFRTCGACLEEAAYYHRVDGLVVKERDDLLSAIRIAMMMRRYAISDPGRGHDADKPLFANIGTMA